MTSVETVCAVLHAAGPSEIYDAFWMGDTLYIYGNDGYDHFDATKGMVADLVRWLSRIGWRHQGMSTDATTGFMWVIAVTPRGMEDSPWSFDRREAAAERIAEHVREQGRKTRPAVEAEDAANTAASKASRGAA